MAFKNLHHDKRSSLNVCVCGGGGCLPDGRLTSPTEDTFSISHLAMLVSLDCGKKTGIPDDERELERNPGPSCYEAAELTTAATCHPQSRIFTTVVGAKKSSFEP